jgi:choline dehydrogenase-like flavoprotein
MTRGRALVPARDTLGSFDYVIVGSGAAGSAAARVLADTGASIAIVEEGPAVSTEQLGGSAWGALLKQYRGMGTQLAKGRASIPLLQGSCLGGSTVVNSAIVRRMPEAVWDGWNGQHGLGEAIPYDALEEKWDLLEHELSALATPEGVWGNNNRLLAAAADRLGVGGAPTTRFVMGCRGSANCSVGCASGAKQSMLVSYLPYARARGAAIFTSARVNKVRMRGSRAVGVGGVRTGTSGAGETRRRFALEARKAVIVAASALQSPQLLSRSGVRSTHLGHHFQAHPGVLLLGLFDDEVNMWSGATQGYEVDHYAEASRFKIETLALPPELILARLPGVGSSWLASIDQARHVASWAVLLRARAEGTVRAARLSGGPEVRYDLDAADMRDLERGIRTAAELFFAAGARQVIPLVHGLPERLTSEDQLSLLDSAPSDPACYSLNTSHLFGTARMSSSSEHGVVAPDFSVHGTEGLYVLDSSVFPSNLGVNPQHTIMAVAMHAASGIAEMRS